MSSPSNSNLQPAAVVLLSGGLDSATTLAVAKKEGYACYALTADYGQRHAIEIEKARQVAAYFNVAEHKLVKVELNQFGGSALTDNIAVPDGRVDRVEQDIPLTYVPARNTVLLSLALAWAEVVQAQAIFIGANSVDYSGYPDCRPEYLKAFEQLAHLATKAGVSQNWQIAIKAPLIHLTKAEIIRLGRSLEVDFSMTNSCYNPAPDGTPCKQCESCVLRAQGFAAAGMDES